MQANRENITSCVLPVHWFRESPAGIPVLVIGAEHRPAFVIHTSHGCLSGMHLLPIS